MKTQLAAFFTGVLLCSAAIADPEVFDFKDPKGINNAAFHLDAPLEAVTGTATGISGKVTFDPKAPGSTTGKIVCTTSSMVVPNAMQTSHMKSPMWMDSVKFPEITFEAKQVNNANTDGHSTTADVTGTFTMKGISKDITIPVKFTYFKDMMGQRMPGTQGDILVIRTQFTVKRSDYNIQPMRMEDKVSDKVDITLSLAGACPK